MNQTYRIGDKVIITKVGFIVKADCTMSDGECEYTVQFHEKGEPYLGRAIVKESIIMQTHEQRLDIKDFERVISKVQTWVEGDAS